MRLRLIACVFSCTSFNSLSKLGFTLAEQTYLSAIASSPSLCFLHALLPNFSNSWRFSILAIRAIHKMDFSFWYSSCISAILILFSQEAASRPEASEGSSNVYLVTSNPASGFFSRTRSHSFYHVKQWKGMTHLKTWMWIKFYFWHRPICKIISRNEWFHFLQPIKEILIIQYFLDESVYSVLHSWFLILRNYETLKETTSLSTYARESIRIPWESCSASDKWVPSIEQNKEWLYPPILYPFDFTKKAHICF